MAYANMILNIVHDSGGGIAAMQTRHTSRRGAAGQQYAIIVGLMLGKPIGFIAFSALAVWLKLAAKPNDYTWAQLAGAGALAGIGFTMSLFIAGQAFPAEGDFAAAKIAVFAASILSAVIGCLILWRVGGATAAQEPVAAPAQA